MLPTFTVCCYVLCVSGLVEVDTLRGMMDFALMFYTLLIAVCVDVVLTLPHLLSTVYHTEVCTILIILCLEFELVQVLVLDDVTIFCMKS